MVAHYVDPGDMGVNAARHVDPLHLGPILGVAEDLFGRQDASLEDPLLVIDVGDERVQRLRALLEATLKPGPLICRQDAWDDVEGDQPLRSRVLAVHREGDAHAVK